MSNYLHSTKNKKKKTVGRGSKRGKTSGRGTKGQKARAGHRIRPHIRDIIKKLPKLRGRGKNSNKPFRLKPAAVNLMMI
ncbi:MAG TPA: uL15 family ribosomal protein, partial [Candidatus Paceibacterota bacterium]|nr:uL15 family ribosomal protein [Candidatus Paceibacterota bacterium]